MGIGERARERGETDIAEEVGEELAERVYVRCERVLRCTRWSRDRI